MKYVSLLLLVFFTSAQILCMRYARTLSGEKYNSTTAVLMGEVMKIIFSFMLLSIQEKSPVRAFKSLKNNAQNEGIDVLKNAVPALLYTIQNNCLYIAISHLDAAVFQVTSQIKLLTAAIFSVLFLKKTITYQQWFSLLILASGVILVQYDQGNNKTQGSGNFLVGLIAILISSVTSGFAGVYMEKLFKDSKYSIWTRNFWLAFWSLLVGFITLLIQDCTLLVPKYFFKGYTIWAWLAIFLLAIGGLIIAMVLKYADNILKAFGNSASILISSIVSVYLFNFVITKPFIIGGCLVAIATILYSYGATRVIQYTPVVTQETEQVTLLPETTVVDTNESTQENPETTSTSLLPVTASTSLLPGPPSKPVESPQEQTTTTTTTQQ
ncbi:hypothetical protein WA158_004173 [Blastocystis sp. Blastoise]